MRIILALFLLFSSTFTFPTNILQNRFTKVIIFGDSYSDTGNVYDLTDKTWPIVPPYYQGRFCNGPIWVDKLNTIKTINYAYGSATTDNGFVPGITKLNTVPVPGIRQQVATYLKTIDTTKFDFPRALYIVWSTGNDFTVNSSIPLPTIVASLMNSVKDLLAAGARNIIVFNSLPLQALPYISRLNQTATFTALTAVANNAIITNLQLIQNNNPSASIYMFDITTLLLTVIANNTAMKFANTVNNCWSNFNITAIQISCSNVSTYVFLDILHVTTRVHQLIADAISPFLSYKFDRNAPGGYVRSF